MAGRAEEHAEPFLGTSNQAAMDRKLRPFCYFLWFSMDPSPVLWFAISYGFLWIQVILLGV